MFPTFLDRNDNYNVNLYECNFIYIYRAISIYAKNIGPVWVCRTKILLWFLMLFLNNHTQNI